MSDRQSPTALICDDLALGWQSGFDLSFQRSVIQEAAQVVRDWNGRAKDWSDPAFRKYQFRISSGTGEMRTPALADKWPGKTFHMVPPIEEKESIPVGGTMKTLLHVPHPSYFRVVDSSFDDVGYTLSGQTVTLDEPAEKVVSILYVREYHVIVTEGHTTSLQEASADIAWDIVVEEVGGDEE